MLADRGHRPRLRRRSCRSAAGVASSSAIFSVPVEALDLELVARASRSALRARLRVARLERRRVGVDLCCCGGGAAGLRAQVGRLLGLARRRRAFSGGRLFGFGGLAPSSGSGVVANTPGRERDEVLAAGGQHAEPLAVGVARAALAGEAGQRLRRLLVDRALGRELLVRRPCPSPTGGSPRSGSSAARRTCAVQRHAARRPGAARAGTVGRRSAARPRSSCLGDQPAQLAHERHRGVDRRASELCTPGRRSAASARSGGNASLSAPSAGLRGAQRARQLGDRRAAGCRPRARTRRRSC